MAVIKKMCLCQTEYYAGKPQFFFHIGNKQNNHGMRGPGLFDVWALTGSSDQMA